MQYPNTPSKEKEPHISSKMWMNSSLISLKDPLNVIETQYRLICFHVISKHPLKRARSSQRENAQMGSYKYTNKECCTLLIARPTATQLYRTWVIPRTNKNRWSCSRPSYDTNGSWPCNQLLASVRSIHPQILTFANIES